MVPRWARRTDVLWRRLPDEVLALCPDADQPTSIGGSGAVLWDLLGEPMTVTDLVDELAQVYQGDAAIIERDVRSALEELAERGLVRLA